MRTEPDDSINFHPVAQRTTGLTKREFFAAMAMQAVCGNIHEHAQSASRAVALADALIKAFNRGDES